MTTLEKIVNKKVILVSAIVGIAILLSANIFTASQLGYLWAQQMVTNNSVAKHTNIPKINMNTSLSQAMMTAEEAVGNNSFAIAAFGSDHRGTLVYTIILGAPGTDFYYVTVDPGNGQVLATEELSKSELEKRHLAHSQKVLEEPHLMNNTFVH
jgi:hypothetical protein